MLLIIHKNMKISINYLNANKQHHITTYELFIKSKIKPFMKTMYGYLHFTKRLKMILRILYSLNYKEIYVLKEIFS